MKKKDYIKPAQRIVMLQSRTRLLQNSRTVSSVRSNMSSSDDFYYDGEGGTYDAR